MRDRWLSSSQVTEWSQGYTVRIPSRPYGLAPVVVESKSVAGLGSTTIPAPTVVLPGDVYLVVVGTSNPLVTPNLPTSSGLTFSLISQRAGIGMWWATSSDITARTVSISAGSGPAITGATILIRDASTVAQGNSGAYSSTTAPVATASSGLGLSVAAILHASYPSTPSFTAPSQWTMAASVLNTGWNGIAVAIRAHSQDLTATFAATPSASGAWASCLVS